VTDVPMPRALGVLAPRPGKAWSGSELKGGVDVVPSSLRERVAGYLEQCPVFLAWMGYTRDLLGDRFGVDGGGAIVSDGAYYWRLDAAAYVREYGIAVPPSALERMQEREFAPPVFSVEEYSLIYRELASILMDGQDA